MTREHYTPICMRIRVPNASVCFGSFIGICFFVSLYSYQIKVLLFILGFEPNDPFVNFHVYSAFSSALVIFSVGLCQCLFFFK